MIRYSRLTNRYGPGGYDGLVSGIANARCNISSSRIFRFLLCVQQWLKLFTTVAFEIEREHAVQARGASKNLGIAKCAYGIVIARTPMILHRQTGKLVVFGVTFVISGPVDQVNDVVDLVTGDRLQDLQIIVFLKIAREPAEKSRKGALHPVHILELRVLARVRLEN
jgi:hypothetical protein